MNSSILCGTRPTRISRKTRARTRTETCANARSRGPRAPARRPPWQFTPTRHHRTPRRSIESKHSVRNKTTEHSTQDPCINIYKNIYKHKIARLARFALSNHVAIHSGLVPWDLAQINWIRAFCVGRGRREFRAGSVREHIRGHVRTQDRGACALCFIDPCCKICTIELHTD